MITRQIALSVYRCDECQTLMIANPSANGPPNACTKCGCPAGVSLTQEDRMRMERMQQQQQQRGPQPGGRIFKMNL